MTSCMVALLGLLSALAMPAQSQTQPYGDEPAVGFVVHPHEAHFEEYTVGGAKTMLSNVFAWRMKDVEKRELDTAWPEKNLRYCAANGLKMAPIIDNSLQWMGDVIVGKLAKEKNETIISNDGKVWTWPSPFSSIYRQETARYAERVTAWVKANDPDRRVFAYMNGAEWYWHGGFDYSVPTLNAFRKWLAQRYGGIEQLNRSWGTQYASFDGAQAPKIFRNGNPTSSLVTFAVGDTWYDASWSRQRDRDIPCRPGDVFEAEVVCRIEGMPVSAVDVQGIWGDAEGKNIAWAFGEVGEPDSAGWRIMRWRDTAPDKTAKLWMHLKTYSPGIVRFDRLTLRQVNGQPKTILDDTFEHPDQTGWQFQNWTGQCEGKAIAEGHRNPGSLQVVVRPQETKYGNTSAAVVDYVEFTWEALADAIEYNAAVIKRCDPSRPVASYLGFAWALPMNWDDAITNHSVDVTIAKAKSLDIVGLQLCSAKGDFHYATEVVDVARKAGKPIWATDLIDFTHGMSVGYETLDQLTQACIQHGMDGVYWYCWYGTPDYNYYTGLKNEEVQALVRNAEDSVRELAGREAVVRVAMVNPIVPYWAGDPDGAKNDAFDAYGWYKLLGEMQIPVDVWTPYELEHASSEALSRYAAIVLPDAPYIPATAVRNLNAYAARGGSLIVSGRKPQHDSHGPRLETVLDVPPARLLRFEDRPGREYLGHVKRFRVAGNTPPLFVEMDDRDPIRARFKNTRGQVRAFLEKAGVRFLLAEDESRIECAAYTGPADTTYFLLRSEGVRGRIESLPVAVQSERVRVKADHGSWAEVAATAGRVVLPSFRTTCLVRVPKP